MVIYASLIAAILPLVVAGPGKKQLDHSQFAQSDIIRRDVAIVGGGASGVHAYFSLKDQGYSSIVIEKKGAIGGHAETYFDLATGTPVNYGVQIFHNTSIVLNYFARFNVTLGGPSLGRGRSGNYDIRTGAQVNVTTYTQEESSAAISKYLEVISQWPDLERGMFLPDPVPEDLTLSFGDFAKKYGIEAIIPTLNVFNNGLGNPLTMPALEMIKGNGQGLLQGLGGGWRAPANGATTAIYTAAQPELLTDNNLLLNSEVVSSNRHAVNETVQLVVKAPSGNKLIIAKKLLITIPPKLNYLRPFNPSRNETQVFSKFVNGGLYATIVNNTGIPSDLTITNTDPASWPNLPLPLPNIYSFMATRVPGLHISYYHTERGNASDPLPKETVKASIIEGVKTLQKANPSWATEQEPEVIVYASHSPYYHQVCAEEIKNGFYKKLYALQGQENTFWTGQAWRAPDSSSLWKFNKEIVLPQLTATL